MSKYAEFVTEMKDSNHLVSALSDLGFKAEVHETAQCLNGYDDKTRKAHIIIRKPADFFGDIGFIKTDNGSFKAVVDDLDMECTLDASTGGLAGSWMNRLKQGYAEHRTIATAKAKGYIYSGKTIIQGANGPQVRLQFAVR